MFDERRRADHAARARTTEATSTRHVRGSSICVALVGAALVWWITPQGAGLSPDSVAYIAGARAALAGQGVLALEGGPLRHFPPLYPLAIALTARISDTEPLAAARLLNAALFGALAATAAWLAARIGRHSTAAAIAALIVLASRETLVLHAMAWSEPLALLMGTAGLAMVARYLDGRRTGSLAGAALLLGMAVLTRYAAVAYAAAAVLGLLILDRSETVSRRLILAGGLLAASLAPLVAWWIGTGSRIGLADRTLAFHPLTWWDWHKFRSAISAWTTPADTPMWLRLGALLAFGALAAVVVRRWRTSPARLGDSQLARLLLLFAALYLTLIVACRIAVDAAILLDSRILAPLYVALVIAAAGLTVRYLPRPMPRDARVALGAAVVFLIAVQGIATFHWASAARAEGLGFTQRRWRGAALLDHVRALPADAHLWSNAPDILYIHTGRCARSLPRHADPQSGRPDSAFAGDWHALRTQSGAYVVWFDAIGWRSYLLQESELTMAGEVERVTAVPGGTLYRITGSDSGAPVSPMPECPGAASQQG